MEAKDGLEAPTKAFLGPCADSPKWFRMSRSCWFQETS